MKYDVLVQRDLRTARPHADFGDDGAAGIDGTPGVAFPAGTHTFAKHELNSNLMYVIRNVELTDDQVEQLRCCRVKLDASKKITALPETDAAGRRIWRPILADVERQVKAEGI